MDYIEINKHSYQAIYKEGWGNKYTDSYLISLYYNIIKPLVNKNTDHGILKCLDFGCSIGANTRFFHEAGYDVYGIDISEEAICKCVSYNKFDKKNFAAANVLKPEECISNLFPGISFDLIIASNVIYYFNSHDTDIVLKQLSESLNPGGVIYANLHSINSYFYENRACTDDGMFLMGEAGSINSVTAMNAVNDREEVEKIFNQFKKEKILHTKVETAEEGKYTEDYHFIGIMNKAVKFKVYSNDLEDLILYYLFKDEENIFYIDIGAGSPDSGSVTRMMYDLSIARGINIEPQRDLFKELCDKRKRDINICAVIGEEKTEEGVEFYLNSVNNSSRKAMTKEVDKDYVPMLTLKNIFDSYVKEGQKLSFLKIDVEGYELDVLRCGFGSCRPQMIIVEYVPGVDTNGYEEYEKILSENRYNYCMTYLSNRYYAAEEADFVKRKLVPVKQMLEAVPCDFNDEKVKKKVAAEQMINETECIENIIKDGNINKVIIWGYGPLGIALHNKIAACGIKDIYIVDKNAGEFDINIKEKIIKPEELLKGSLDINTVFLTFQQNEEIIKQLQDYNIISIFDI